MQEPGANAYRVLVVAEGLRLPERGLFDGGVLALAGPVCGFGQALESVQRLYPDVMLVDLTSGEALQAIVQVMAERPVPILALHPGALPRGQAFQALASGALDVVDVPHSPTAAFWQGIGRKLALLAEVRVTRQVPAGGRAVAQVPQGQAPYPVVAIAASLGGPKALSVLLRHLPKDFAAPVCICQHISEGFTEGLAQWLTGSSALRVVEAADGARMEPGSVYIAPSGVHLVVKAQGTLRLDTSPPVRGFRPSCDVLLGSVAESFGPRAMGVVLTGMGRDGARGLKEIRERGGHTIAQDEKSSVIYGMPREAVRIGAAEQVLPLEQIAPMLMQWVETC